LKRLHYFTAGALPVVGYLLGWLTPVWAAMVLSAGALVSERLTVGALAARLFRHGTDASQTGREPTILKFEEAVRLLLLGSGGGMLVAGMPLGWLPVLSAGIIALLAAPAGFSLLLVPYAALKAGLGIFRRPAGESAAALPEVRRCLISQGLGPTFLPWCRWCGVSSVRSYCTLQACLALGLLVAVTFLLTSGLDPMAAKAIIAVSLVGVAGIALAISDETQDLVQNLGRLEELQRHTEERCQFVKRLALAKSVEEAADISVGFVQALLGARRVSLMLPEGGKLRIAASRGIAPEVVRQVAVPVGERICGRVFEQGGPLVLEESAGEAPGQVLGLKGRGSSVTYPIMSAPMTTAQRQVGVLNATDKPGGRFSEQDLADLGFIAEASAIGLSNQLDRLELERVDFETIQALATTVEAKDTYVHGHSERVLTWAVATGRGLGLEEERLQTLSRGAELHDIGKLAIPDRILHARRRLTTEEWAIVREHPTRGVSLVRHLGFLRPTHPVILHHHERLDGSGYPEGLRGENIPLESRIIAVVDAYDAMTSERPYRRPLSHEEAVEELVRCSGIQFDPRCVEAFLKYISHANTPRDSRTETEAVVH